MGVIAARRFADHHERALCILRALGYLSGPLSLSRFNRRSHALAHRLSDAVDLLAAALTAGTIFILDSVPLPVRRRVRAWRCKKVRGADYCGYCAAKEETGALVYWEGGSRRMVRTRAPMQHRLRPRECPPSSGVRQVWTVSSGVGHASRGKTPAAR